jgi:hypothetical protein
MIGSKGDRRPRTSNILKLKVDQCFRERSFVYNDQATYNWSICFQNVYFCLTDSTKFGIGYLIFRKLNNFSCVL